MEGIAQREEARAAPMVPLERAKAEEVLRPCASLLDVYSPARGGRRT